MPFRKSFGATAVMFLIAAPLAHARGSDQDAAAAEQSRDREGAVAPLPAGPGKKPTVTICARCHGIETVIAARHTQIGWNDIVDEMVTRGAKGSDEDLVAVIEYLTANFGKVNVNTASTQELQKFLGLTEAEARSILTYRDQNGKIKHFEQLSTVPGANPEKLRQKRALIAFNQ